jgi:RNA recognition motif-containing protein
MTEDELRKEFTAFGEVISVTIMDDRYIGSGQPRGYGFVEMTSKSEGTTAIDNLCYNNINSYYNDELINQIEKNTGGVRNDDRKISSSAGHRF